MKGIQKLLALFLILCLALSLVPAAFAVDGEGEEVPVVDLEGEEKIGDGTVGQVVVGDLNVTILGQEVAGSVTYVEKGTGSVDYNQGNNTFTVSDESGDKNYAGTIGEPKDIVVNVEAPINTSKDDMAAMDVGSLAKTELDVNATDVANTGAGGGVHAVTATADAVIDVTVADVNGGEYGLEAKAYAGSLTIQADNVEGRDYGIKAGIAAEPADAAESTQVVQIGENTEADTKGQLDILVTGTVSGNTGILLQDSVTADNTSITVGKIESAADDTDEENLVTGQPEEIIKAVIHYIVNLLQPDNGTLSATKSDGSNLDEYHNLPTAQEGDKVRLNIAYDSSKFELDGVYNGEGDQKESLEKDEGGFFYMVKRGGGIVLSAVLKQIVKPAPAPVPVPDTASVAPAADTGAVVKYDGALGCYSLTLTARSNSITFLRRTLEKFQKISDNFLIITPSGSCTVLLSEILNFNEKAVNFRFTYTGSGLEIFSNGELCKSIGSAEMA